MATVQTVHSKPPPLPDPPPKPPDPSPNIANPNVDDIDSAKVKPPVDDSGLKKDFGNNTKTSLTDNSVAQKLTIGMDSEVTKTSLDTQKPINSSNIAPNSHRVLHLKYVSLDKSYIDLHEKFCKFGPIKEIRPLQSVSRLLSWRGLCIVMKVWAMAAGKVFLRGRFNHAAHTIPELSDQDSQTGV
ncbi:uncharacterized protein LOC143040104 [Oratosquilla oratoria]|uniref:uncharacterized protein LOC143040104 n=1 Tax=Oratosquilla oratoria TaxID=337810 RepID=UPI003F7675D5